MAGLAHDWPETRQTCVDILCAYLRLPYDPDPGDADPDKRTAYRANREVRHTIIRLIGMHLRPDELRDKNAVESWQGLNLDFTGVVFDGGAFTYARFSFGTVSFSGAEFSGGRVDFTGAEFSIGLVDFTGAEFSGGTVDFLIAKFSGGVDFSGAEFSGGTVRFSGAEFSRGTVDFGGAVFFRGAGSSGGAEFSGGLVDFVGAKFSGGTVDFRGARRWSPPPVFDFEGAPPEGLMLPAGAMPGRPDSLGSETAG